LLTIAAQGPLDEQGAVLHAGDPAAQLALALGNVLAVVEAAGLPPTALAQLRAYTTDLHALSSCLELVVEHLGGPDRAPPTTCVGVADLGDPRVLVVLEGLAAG
jgi:enamine deaminase RidA (YjgF/YER057c/UK114 family)